MHYLYNFFIEYKYNYRKKLGGRIRLVIVGSAPLGKVYLTNLCTEPVTVNVSGVQARLGIDSWSP